jgi:ADP-ribose pyrophosphatase YjhB (NUDIX family)
MNRLPKFCPQCGGLLNLEQRDGRMRPSCAACGRIVYLNPAPSVAAILFREGRVLLVKRNVEPGYGRWCLPGGFVELDETLEQAVIREVAEETGLACLPGTIVGAQAILGGYYGDLIVICYSAFPVEGELCAGEDADEAQFFDLSQLPEFAFTIHRAFLEKFLESKIEILQA